MLSKIGGKELLLLSVISHSYCVVGKNTTEKEQLKVYLIRLDLIRTKNLNSVTATNKEDFHDVFGFSNGPPTDST